MCIINFYLLILILIIYIYKVFSDLEINEFEDLLFDVYCFIIHKIIAVTINVNLNFKNHKYEKFIPNSLYIVYIKHDHKSSGFKKRK